MENKLRIRVDWMKCQATKNEFVWYPLDRVNLSHEYFIDIEGVYIIWSKDEDSIIRIGSGDIRDRISDHRNNLEITTYKNPLVTWAIIDAKSMRAVEKYLANVLLPDVGERFPDEEPIEVNLPELLS